MTNDRTAADLLETMRQDMLRDRAAGTSVTDIQRALLPMIRRVVPSLIADDLIGVQPMGNPRQSDEVITSDMCTYLDTMIGKLIALGLDDDAVALGTIRRNLTTMVPPKAATSYSLEPLHPTRHGFPLSFRAQYTQMWPTAGTQEDELRGG
jgi:Major capsid protein Gp23